MWMGLKCSLSSIIIFNWIELPYKVIIREAKLCILSLQIIMCGSNLETFYDDKIPKHVFPSEYLPDDYTGPNNGSIKDMISKFLKRTLNKNAFK